MAFSGILVTAGYVGSHTNRAKTLALPGKAAWSEASALPYTTTGAAPASGDNDGDPVFTVVSDVDAYVVIGPAAAAGGPRYLIRSNVERTLYAQPGDKLYAVAA